MRPFDGEYIHAAGSQGLRRGDGQSTSLPMKRGGWQQFAGPLQRDCFRLRHFLQNGDLPFAGQQMHIPSMALDRYRNAGPLRVRTRPTVDYRRPMPLHPGRGFPESLINHCGQLTIGSGTDIDQQIAAPGPQA